jgi:hypothetical protein
MSTQTGQPIGRPDKKEKTVVSFEKFKDGTYALKEVNQKMLKQMNCEFTLRFTRDGVIPEVIVPPSEFVKGDQKTRISYSDYIAGMNYLGSITAAAYNTLKDETAVMYRTALCSLIVTGLGTTLEKKTISEITKVKQIGTYVLQSVFLADYISKLEKPTDNQAHCTELINEIQKWIRDIPTIIKNRLAKIGLTKINQDKPCGDQIPAWLNGKISAFALPKDLEEEVSVDICQARWLFGKAYGSGIYLTWDELDLINMSCFNTLKGIRKIVRSAVSTIAADVGGEPIIQEMVNMENQTVSNLLKKRKFHVPTREFYAYPGRPDDRMVMIKGSQSPAEKAILSVLRLRAGVIDSMYSERPRAALNKKATSIELTLNPDFQTILGKHSS